MHRSISQPSNGTIISSVSSDHQQHQVYAADSSEHVAHEALVAGDIDEAETEFLAVGRRQFKVGEAEFNGDAAAFFLSRRSASMPVRALTSAVFP